MARRIAAITQDAGRRARDFHLPTRYCGKFDERMTMMLEMGTGVLFVCSDYGTESQKKADEIVGLIIQRLKEKYEGQAGVVNDPDIFTDGRMEKAKGQRYLIVPYGSDPIVLTRSLPFSDRLLIVITGLKGKLCQDVLVSIRTRLFTDFVITQPQARLTWAALLRGLRFIIRCQFGHDATVHADVFSPILENAAFSN